MSDDQNEHHGHETTVTTNTEIKMATTQYYEGEKIAIGNGYHLEIMAIKKKYAMCRKKGCAPFVCAVSELDEKISHLRVLKNLDHKS